MSLLSRVVGWAFPNASPQPVDVLHHRETYVDHKSRTILVASFTGICGDGCRSADAVAQMDRVVWRAMCARRPYGLIMDFRGLEYQWGDNLIQPLNYHPDEQPLSLVDHDDYSPLKSPRQLSNFPVAYVISDRNRTGLTSLVEDELMLPPSEYLFETLEAAMDAVAVRMASP